MEFAAYLIVQIMKECTNQEVKDLFNKRMDEYGKQRLKAMRFHDDEDIEDIHERIRAWVQEGYILKDDADKEHKDKTAKKELAEFLCSFCGH